MSYTPTTWVEAVTKLGPTNMNHLELGVQATAVVADAATAAIAAPVFVAFASFGSGWSQLAGAATSGYILGVGRILTVVVEVAGNTVGTIATLPAGFRPANTIHFAARGDDAVNTTICFGRVTSAGTIIADTVKAGGTPQLGFTVTFPV